MTTYRRTSELLEAEVGDELVGLEPRLGHCFGLNSVAADVWRQLEQPQTFAALRDYLLTNYEVESEQCAHELRELLDEMAAKGLVAAEA
ncbi:PqqD family protein [Sphingomonas sabuli]|uniref:PqqD family protein n=1 Tax=Sphingomonas sabuli TaxID=2764186 RepID=A0A7G9L450_9SPHN|nr:PqqD family protein [Sphingomonas sabuli]QNM83399.1 PqqD family protein [Sphingomonas sabuli]